MSIPTMEGVLYYMIRRLKRKLRIKVTRVIPLRDQIEDFLEDHHFEIGLSLALVLFGTRALVNGLSSAPGSVQTLPLWLAFTYCGLSVLGGVSVLFGLFCHAYFTWAYGVERFGLFVSASAWASYIVGLLFVRVTASSTLLILALFFLSVGCLLRARAINRKEKATLIALRHACEETREESDG